MRFPNLKHLYYLTVLHKEQHFAKAAQKCNVSQSTLSTAIQNLEENIGQQLLEREHKTFVFTDFGEDLVDRSKQLLAHAQDWTNFAESSGDWQSGVLKLGVIPTIAPFMFESIITAVHQHLPKLHLQLMEDTTDNLLTKLSDGEVDLLLLALPMKTPGCKQLSLGKDPFHLVAHESRKNELASSFSIDSLPNDSIFLLQKEHCLTEHAVSACGLAHKAQVSSLTASSLHTLVALVNSKMGFSFMPEMALDQGVLSGTDVVAMPAEDDAYREIGLTWRVGTTRMQLFRKVATIIAKLLPQPRADL
ncbi:LysR substrate-binding domain-containing protein [Glaciecola siphonariae]|uniref:LysR substrate-binding domain-containing protein n=1 Tax=Glaciecola siphonariae TaxID=521012 RepID=A0ABV9LXY2_9ALTE